MSLAARSIGSDAKGLTRRLPDPTVPPEDWREEPESIGNLLAAGANLVAMVVDDPELAGQLQAMLRGPEIVVAGAESIATAAAVLVRAGADPERSVAQARRLARTDAAIVVLVDSAAASAIAHDVGAFGCIREPVVAEELRVVLGRALDARAARALTADLLEKLQRESRLASIGRISAGLTHELASPVGAAILSFETVRKAFGAMSGRAADAELAGAIDDLALSLRRIRDVLAVLQPVVRNEPARLDRVALGGILEEALAAASDKLAGVEVERVLEPVDGLGERPLLFQLLVNLIANAAHAARSLPSPRVRVHCYRAPGQAVLSVRDNGPGVPLEFQEKIFEPFFTTRRELGGTGLGLALCREYAERMGATLSLWSTPGRGACFRVTLKVP